MRPPALSPARLVRRQVVLEDHVPLPDGRGAIVVERRVEANAYRSHLLLVPFVPGVKVRALTGGAVRDTTPQVSPDGRRVAFVRTIPADPDAPTRLMLADLEGGEPEVALGGPARDRRAGVVARRGIARDRRPGRSCPLHRRGRAGEAVADCPAHHPHRLALG